MNNEVAKLPETPQMDITFFFNTVNVKRTMTD